MKYALLCLSCIISLHSTGQESPGISTRWIETSRQDASGKTIPYQDTLFLQKSAPSEISIRKGSFMYKGEVKGKMLELGHISYKIEKNNDKEIRLKDEDVLHIFTKAVKDTSAMDAIVRMPAIALPAAPVSALDPAVLQGEWEAYKRSGKNGPLTNIDYSKLIKAMSFYPEPKEGNLGSVYITVKSNHPLYQVREIKAPYLAVADEEHKMHKLTVWKSDKEELIIEDEAGIIYYMKRVK
jgi:hypothetical protein